MNAKVKDGKLVIEIELERTPRPSASGKTLVVATTGGFKVTNAEVDGKHVSISVNAIVPKAA